MKSTCPIGNLELLFDIEAAAGLSSPATATIVIDDVGPLNSFDGDQLLLEELKILTQRFKTQPHLTEVPPK